MWPYYQASLEKGEDPAALRELLESLWVKMNDVVLLRSASSAKFFAGFPTGYTILLGGQDTLGHDAETPLSQLCLDTYQDILLPQPNLGVRVHEGMSRAFLLKAAETIRIGTGIPQVFNDEGVIASQMNRGVSLAGRARLLGRRLRRAVDSRQDLRPARHRDVQSAQGAGTDPEVVPRRRGSQL